MIYAYVIFLVGSLFITKIITEYLIEQDKNKNNPMYPKKIHKNAIQKLEEKAKEIPAIKECTDTLNKYKEESAVYLNDKLAYGLSHSDEIKKNLKEKSKKRVCSVLSSIATNSKKAVAFILLQLIRMAENSKKVLRYIVVVTRRKTRIFGFETKRHIKYTCETASHQIPKLKQNIGLYSNKILNFGKKAVINALKTMTVLLQSLWLLLLRLTEVVINKSKIIPEIFAFVFWKIAEAIVFVREKK